MFIQTVSEAEAEGKVREVYDGDKETFGYVPNHAKVFSLRPDVLKAWRGLQGSIRQNLSVRRYELVTLAAARALDSRYCLLAHGAVLINNGVALPQLRAILTDFHDAGLEPAEVGMMEYAQKIARSANEITQADVDALRALGLEDVADPRRRAYGDDALLRQQDVQCPRSRVGCRVRRTRRATL